MSKNLNKGPKAQDKAMELNINFGGGSASKDSNTAFQIPLKWAKDGVVNIKLLTIKLEFNEVIQDGKYIKSVHSIERTADLIEKVGQHMSKIVTANNQDTRHTAEYTIVCSGMDFNLKASEREARLEDAKKLLNLGRWVTREGQVIDAQSDKIPTYLYLLEKPAVVFECNGVKETLSCREAATQLVALEYGDEIEEPNIFDKIADKIQTPMFKQWKKEQDAIEDINAALQREIDRRKEEARKEKEELEKQELEKEIAPIKTEVINRAVRYEALIGRVGDKVALLTGLRGKPLDVLLGVQGALAQGNKDRAVELAFDVDAIELAFLKECYNNKSNLKWIKDNKSKFEAPQN